MTDLGVGVALVALFFLGMGALGIGAPARILAPFGTADLTIDARNEVRAVYGGFGIVIGVLLIVTAGVPALRAGVLATVGTALAGMAGGRVVSVTIERPSRFYPCWFYLPLEAAMAAVLFAAI